MESILGFRYSFTNGSSRVSNKGLRDPSRPSNIFIIRTNKFGIDVPIISATKSIRRISFSGKVIGDSITPFGNTTLIDLFHFLLRHLPFLHKCNVFCGRGSFSFLLLVLPSLVLLLGRASTKPNAFLTNCLLLRTQEVIKILFSLNARNESLLKLCLQPSVFLNKRDMLTTRISGTRFLYHENRRKSVNFFSEFDGGFLMCFLEDHKFVL